MSTINPTNLAEPTPANLAVLVANAASLNADISDAATLGTPTLVGGTYAAALAAVYAKQQAINAEIDNAATLTEPDLDTHGFVGVLGPSGVLLANDLALQAAIDAQAGAITLSWTDTSALETGFRVEISTDGVSYTTAGTVAANAETYTIEGLGYNTQYYVRVIAFNGIGDSETVLGPALVYTQPPSGVGNLTATTSAGEVALSWSAPSVAPISGYAIYQSEDNTTYTLSQLVEVGNNNATITGLDASATYYFRVAAYNDNGDYANAETTSDSVSATLPADVIGIELGSDGETVTITLSEPHDFGAGGSGGFALSSDGGAVSVTAVNPASATPIITLTTSRVVYKGEVLHLSYSQPGDGLETASGVDLASFVSEPVSNNSGQVDWVIGPALGDATSSATAPSGVSDLGTVEYNRQPSPFGDYAFAITSQLGWIRWDFAEQGRLSLFMLIQPTNDQDTAIWLLYPGQSSTIIYFDTDRITIDHGETDIDFIGTTFASGSQNAVWIDYWPAATPGLAGSADGVLEIRANRNSTSLGKPAAPLCRVDVGTGGPISGMRVLHGPGSGETLFNFVRIAGDEIGSNPVTL